MFTWLVGLPANLLNRLQSVLNAAVLSVAGLRRSAHITLTDTFASFHAAYVLQRKWSSNWRSLSTELFTGLRLAVSVWSFEPPWWHVVPESVSRLRSSTSNLRSVASASRNLSNSLPDDITSASSRTMFQRKLKTHLFRQSYPNPNIIIVCGCSRRGGLSSYLLRPSQCKCKCRFIERDYVTPLMRCRLECPPKLFGVDSWIPQIIGQWIPDSEIVM